ncbi:MAG: hypothetical protein PHV30_09135 [Candidatus Margulisbacteria bacterium]|nr:hypothetical protein [Candidatus Margulisiibacteriota bacterium]
MALRIITGTLNNASDPFGLMEELQQSSALDRWYWTFSGWKSRPVCKLGLGIIRNGEFGIIQPTSVGKTVVGVTLLFLTHIRGGQIAGNLKLKWTDNILTSMGSLNKMQKTHCLVDDLRKTIKNWKDKTASLASEVANEGGKKENQIDITSQRIINMVPPDLVNLCDEIFVPWILWTDLTRDNPRGNSKGVPVKIAILQFTGGNEFVGIYKVINYNNPTGQEILSGFDTLQIANALTGGEVRK